MNDDDKARFTSNYEWFSRFFDGVRQFYGLVIESLPVGFMPAEFSESSGNYYFPRQNFAPTMPEHYTLMLGGREAALQIIAVFDVQLFTGLSRFAHEPSIVVVLHSQSSRCGYVQDYGLRVISGSGIDVEPGDAPTTLVGRINSTPEARFAARQIIFDRLSSPENVRDAIERDIVGLIAEVVPTWCRH
jgi:hypothetical protein